LQIDRAVQRGVDQAGEPYSVDLRQYAIKPGSVATAIWDKAEALSLDHLAGIIWDQPFRAFAEYMIKNGCKGFAPERVGDVVAEALTASRP